MLNLVIPEINGKPKTTKDFVITILSKEWPLSLRNLYSRIKKSYGYSSSYQSVYKAVKELVEEEVLIENDKKYNINISWIKNLQSFTDIVETNHYAKERIETLTGIKDSDKNANTTILEFENIFDTEKYLYYLTKNELLKKENEVICWYNLNEWRPIFYLRSEYNYYKRLLKKKHKCYVLCSGKSKMEAGCRDFYQKIGVRFNFIPDRFVNNMIAFSDFVVQIFIPEDLLSKINSCLDKNKEYELLELLEKKSSIKVVITRDAELAKQMKNKIMARF